MILLGKSEKTVGKKMYHPAVPDPGLGRQKLEQPGTQCSPALAGGRRGRAAVAGLGADHNIMFLTSGVTGDS